VGTGTMLSGLINSANAFQKVIGISVLKNNFSQEQEIQKLLHPQKTFQLLHDFHFGGYAKHTPVLLQFMNDWFAATGIPADFVYTAKMFFAADQLIRSGFFPAGQFAAAGAQRWAAGQPFAAARCALLLKLLQIGDYICSVPPIQYV
jgi:1-aminocyclopropane-1-carboxylate deaminase